MASKDLPFNIKILSSDRASVRGMYPVTALDMYDHNTGEYHPNGLYSNAIFGRAGSDLRNEAHGFINLRTTVMHPKIYLEITRLKGLYSQIMAGKEYAVYDKKTRDFVKSDALDGETGYSFFKSHFFDVKFKRNKSSQRDLRIDLIDKYRKFAYTDFQIVSPAGIRDVKLDESGRPIEVDVNKVYRRLIMLSNTIPETMLDKEDVLLDKTRWTLQLAIQELWEYHMMFVGGKNGFLEAKFGSRKVAYGTTNVMSSMDPACVDMDGARAMDNTHTISGIHQFLKGTEPMATGFYMRNGIAQSMIENIDGEVELIHPKTYKKVTVRLGENDRTNWGTEDGLAGLIDKFHNVDVRHRPVNIAGKYLALLYRDNKNYKVIYDIDTVPDHIDRDRIAPLTWAEFFYITVMSYKNRVRCYINRYPITGTGSIYYSNVYIQSTGISEQLRELNDDLYEDRNATVLPEFPDPGHASAFMDTTAPHVSQLGNLSGDYDGDRSSTTFVFSDEAVAEVDEKLDDPASHLTPAGGLVQPSGTDIVDWVLNNFTGFK